MTNQQGAPEALTDPSPDQIRAIARTARNSSGSASDDCGPLAYVLHGWRAALQQGYDAARLEIDSFRARVQELEAQISRPAGKYLPLPVRYAYDDEGNELFSAAQMFNFVDADRAMRAQAAPAAVAVPSWNRYCAAGICLETDGVHDACCKRNTTPQPTKPAPAMREAVAKVIYDQWVYKDGWRAWVNRGNSLRQDEARCLADLAFAMAQAAPQQEAQADSKPVPAVDKCTKQQMTTEVLRRMQQQEDGHNKNPFRSLLDRLMRNEGGYSTIEIGQLKYALDGFYGAAYAMPQQESQEPYAYAVYFPDQPTAELVHDLDELTDDLTNREHQITKLYAAHQPAPSAIAGPSQWACKTCGCEYGVAGEPYWTHDRTPHPVEAIWRCDKCDATHEIKLVEPTQAAPAAQGDAEDAARYRCISRRQHWSVIDGSGNELHAEALDTAIDAALKQRGNV